MARLTGVYGGTFDPPHWGHLILAEGARVELNLDRVLWVVTGDPPHKPEQPITPAGIRVRMVEAAIHGNPHFELSLADLERPQPHFAVGTMAWLKRRHPQAEYAYLMGSDSLRDLPAWHRPGDLLRAAAQIAVMRRPGVEVEVQELEQKLPGLTGKLVFFDSPPIGLSGRDIRRRVHEGKAFRYMVPETVAQIILDEGLYL